MKAKLAFMSLMIGALLEVFVLVMGINVQWFSPICDALLAPGSRIATAIPGGGMHNPLASLAGLFANSLIFGLPVFLITYAILTRTKAPR